MKTYPILAFAVALLTSVSLHAAGEGDENTHEKKIAGPNGGRILTTIEPHAEFFVTEDRKVQITFLGEDLKPVAPADQVVTVTTGERSAPVKMTFTESGESLVSEESVPEGNNFPAVVQIKNTAEAKAQVEKFTLNFSVCSECDMAEYACICDHAH